MLHHKSMIISVANWEWALYYNTRLDTRILDVDPQAVLPTFGISSGADVMKRHQIFVGRIIRLVSPVTLLAIGWIIVPTLLVDIEHLRTMPTPKIPRSLMRRRLKLDQPVTHPVDLEGAQASSCSAL